ncbi:MAG TPA: ABC transporter permease [Pyrinomonadaceae bacterium]|nr:ABC transporter permease [Pyrinomonadaceae bacterium]
MLRDESIFRCSTSDNNQSIRWTKFNDNYKFRGMLSLWNDLLADLRFAIRTLSKSPGFTAIIIGSLALGIGANVAIFTVAKQVLLDRLAVPHPEQLKLLTWTAPTSSIVHHSSNDLGPNGERTVFPYPVYQQLRKENTVLGDLFAFKTVGRLSATIEGEAVAVTTQMVSGNYYKALEVSPVLGRPIEPSDDASPGREAVAVISHDLWTTYFGSAKSVIGKSITVNGHQLTIIGVNPPGFTGAGDAHISPGILVPFSMYPVLLPRAEGSALTDQEYWWIQIMGRLSADVPTQTAQTSLNTLLHGVLLATVNPEKHEEIPSLVLVDGSRGLKGSTRALTQQTYLLLALVGFVLLLACANIANLLLTRSAGRQREISIRIALGAGRVRIFRQMLTESLLLCLLGGILGLVVGFAGRNLLPTLLSTPWAQPALNGDFDQRVFLFTAAISLLAGLLFGLAPAWQAIRTTPELQGRMRAEISRRKGLANKVIVCFQVGLSTLLIVGAMLFVRTLFNLNSVDTGFRVDQLLLFRIQLPPSLYPPPQDVMVARKIEEQLAVIPGVESVTASSVPLLANAFSTSGFNRLDQPQSNQGDVWTNTVGQDFFQTMGIPILAGRGFNSTDTDTSQKVAVINQTLARKYFPDTNPIDKTFNGYGSISKVPFQIVGICADTRYENLRKEPPATYYVFYHQIPRTYGDMSYEVRTRVQPYSLVPLIRSAVQSVDKNIPLTGIRTQKDQINDTIRQERLLANMTVIFGILALLLACIGIYGVMAHTVARRTNEIGVRVALGAQNRTIFGMILNEAFRVTVIGVVVGLGVGYWLTQFLRTVLFGLEPADPIAMVSAALVLMTVALIAAFIPALRASRIDPVQALRSE